MTSAPETTTVITPNDIFMIILVLGISFVLLVVAFILIVPRKKASPAINAENSVKKLNALAEKLCVSPTVDNLKKVRAQARACENALVTAQYKGILEVNPAVALNEEVLKIASSLIVTKANSEEIRSFSEILLKNVRHELVILEPLAKTEINDSAIALSTSHGAKNYLSSIKDKYDIKDVDNGGEDAPD